MRREQLTEKILDIKRAKGWSWKHITDEIGGMSPVLVVGALLGQMKLVKPLAAKAGAARPRQNRASEKRREEIFIGEVSEVEKWDAGCIPRQLQAWILHPLSPGGSGPKLNLCHLPGPIRPSRSGGGRRQIGRAHV